MLEPYYNKRDIDTKDIWEYEHSELVAKGNPKIFDQLLGVIEPIIAESTTPFNAPEKSSARRKYSKNFEQRYRERETSWFRKDEDYYSYQKPCPVKFDANNQRDFIFLFTLKLRQYHDNLPALDAFLYYQLKENFNSDCKKFTSFIQALLIQNNYILGEAFEKKIALWETNYDPKELEIKTDDWQFEDPRCWQKVEVGLTDDQVKVFFSFLYLEKNDRGLPFLEKKDTEQLLRFGFCVPPQPLPQKFKLNLTSKYRKSIIETCIYHLFKKYSNNQKNKQPFLRFLAYQLVQFERVKTPEDFKNWGKNFTPVKLKTELPFDIKKYFDKVKAA